MKTGCGKSVTKGHGEVAVCGKDYYGEIYTCDSCLKLRVAELESVLKIALKQLEEWEVTIDHEFGDCRQLDAIEAAGDLSEATVAVRSAIAKINEVLK